MDASIISALAALTGAAVGGLTSGIANWRSQRSQVRAQWVLHEETRRQTLSLVSLYAKMSAMRAISSKPVVHHAEDVTRKILDTYLQPDKSFVELREMAIDGTIDMLRGFSQACRDEFEQMRPIHF